MCAHAEFITFGVTEGIGCVRPCRVYYFWHNRRHWVCAHAEFITFGVTGGIGCVPMQSLLLLA